MKTIKLYGHLGAKFGKVHRFDVRTPAEAVKALSANFPEFKKYLIDNSEPGYKVLVGRENRSEPELLHVPAEGVTISIVPVVQGAGGNNIGTIILGVILMVVAWWNPYNWALLGAGGLAGGAGTLAATVTFKVGAALVLAGVSAMLFTPPKADSQDREERRLSTNFNGAINLSAQGNPVPLAYGKVMAGSQVVAAGIKTTKVAA